MLTCWTDHNTFVGLPASVRRIESASDNGCDQQTSSTVADAGTGTRLVTKYQSHCHPATFTGARSACVSTYPGGSTGLSSSAVADASMPIRCKLCAEPW